MNPSEITSSTTACDEHQPIRLDSPMMLAVTSTDSSSSPLRPLLITYTTSNARRPSITVTASTTTFTGLRTRNATRKNVSHRGALLHRRVPRLEPGQVQQHDVAGVPPPGGHQHRVQVDVGVAQPVHRVG